MRQSAVAVFLALFLTATAASAGVQNGLGLGMGVDRGMKSGTHYTMNLRLRAISVTPLEFEFTYLAGRGLAMNLNLYLLHTKWVKWHFIDPGVYLAVGTGMINNPELKRAYDLSFGTGLEVKTWRNIVVYANARWYLPDPAATLKEAKRRGQEAGNANQNFGSGIDSAMNFAKDTYLGALKDWHLTVGAMWFF